MRAKRGRAGLLLAGLVAGYVFFWGGLTSLRHYHFHTGLDLANQHQAVWNSTQGRLLARSMEVSIDLADHVRPYLVVLSPVYAVFPTAYVLLIFQTLVLALGALPLYRLSRRKLRSPGASLAMALCFLGYPGLGFVNRYDFHAEVIAVPLLLAAYERIDAGNLRTAGFLMGLALLGKEDVGFSVAMLGIMVAVVHRYWLFGLTWGLVGSSYSLLALFVIIPFFRGGASDTLARYSELGITPWDMLTTVIAHPSLLLEKILTTGNLITALQLIAPLAFFPILALPALIPALPSLFFNFASDYWRQKTIYFHYMAPAFPFLFVATVEGQRRLANLLSRITGSGRELTTADAARRGLGCGIVCVLLATIAAWIYENPVTARTPAPPANRAPAASSVEKKTMRRYSTPGILANAAAVREALKRAPPEGLLLTTAQYLPHLAQRREIGVIPRPQRPVLRAEAETILVNSRDLRNRTCEDYFLTFRQAAASGFGITFERDGVVLLQKHAGDARKLRDLVADWPGCR